MGISLPTLHYSITPSLHAVNYWLVKQEPEDYAWTAFEKDGRAAWTGVRNFQARNFLRAMKKGDQVLYYHSGEAKQVVGIARVAQEAYPDSTAEEGDWSCVDLVPVRPLKKPVPLTRIKSDPLLKQIHLVRNGRLSVMPLTREQFGRIVEMTNQ
jgi:predicted RNA-binding protein with PUA-like domain